MHPTKKAPAFQGIRTRTDARFRKRSRAFYRVRIAVASPAHKTHQGNYKTKYTMAPPKEERQKENKRENDTLLTDEENKPKEKRQKENESSEKNHTVLTDKENNRLQRAWRSFVYGVPLDPEEDDWGDAENEMTKEEFEQVWEDWTEEGRAWMASGDKLEKRATVAKAKK